METYDSTERRNKKDRRGSIETEKQLMVIINTEVFENYGVAAFFQCENNHVLLVPPVSNRLAMDKRRSKKIGQNARQVNDFIIKALAGRSPSEIRNGIPLCELSSLLYGKRVRAHVGGRLFIQNNPSRNDPSLFTEEFETAEIIGVCIRKRDGTEEIISVCEDIAVQMKQAFRHKTAREVLSIALEMRQNGEDIMLITDDKIFLKEIMLEGIKAREYEENIVLSQIQGKIKRPRQASQRNQVVW